LKALKRDQPGQAYERFSREVSAIRKLRHPNIITIVDSSAPDDKFQFYVMEHIEGANKLLSTAALLFVFGLINSLRGLSTDSGLVGVLNGLASAAIGGFACILLYGLLVFPTLFLLVLVVDFVLFKLFRSLHSDDRGAFVRSVVIETMLFLLGSLYLAIANSAPVWLVFVSGLAIGELMRYWYFFRRG
jgi:hypothetical protein